MATVHCLRHFETAVDPDTPPSEWGLSDAGEAAEAAFLDEGLPRDVVAVYASPEPKARGTAERAADRADVPLRVEAALAEVDRSGEGFIDDPARYDEMVKRYFGAPEVPFDWEDRRDVESRIRGFVAGLDADDPVLLVSHGMLLSTMLAPVLGREPFAFWAALSFGELLSVESGALRRQWG